MTQAEFETIRHSFDVYGYLGHDQTEELITEIDRLRALVKEAFREGTFPVPSWVDSNAKHELEDE